MYVVNPSIEWTNDQIQSSQPGSVPFTVCTKIMATALITIRSTNGGGTQFRFPFDQSISDLNLSRITHDRVQLLGLWQGRAGAFACPAYI